MTPLKIIGTPVDKGGCGWYRVRQPFAMIKQHTEHDAYVMDAHEEDMTAIASALTVADVGVIRQGGEAAISYFRSQPEYKQIKWVLDIDDNIEAISPYSQHYEEYGIEEFFDPSLKKWLWKNGDNGFDANKNRARVQSLITGMKQADMVSVTTPVLAEYAKQYNPNVAVLPNVIDLSQWWKLDLKPSKTLRVGWHGGVSHYEDWYAIKKPLNDLMREYQFTLVMVGSHYDGLIDKDNKHLVEVRPWVPFEAHSYRMMALALDIALIPLADLPFNRYKSAIKWYEMAAMGVPSLVSDITPYREEIQERKTALGYRDQTGFRTGLRYLLDHPQRRIEIGNAARQWVERNRDAAKCAILWTDTYGNLKRQ
jgi:glycosyltransferase involved in cell wall biosynthesis